MGEETPFGKVEELSINRRTDAGPALLEEKEAAHSKKGAMSDLVRAQRWGGNCM